MNKNQEELERIIQKICKKINPNFTDNIFIQDDFNTPPNNWTVVLIKTIASAIISAGYIKLSDVELDEEKEVEIYVVNGVEGKSIIINGYRVAGSKPWGGGTIIHKWTATMKDILEAIPELKAIAQAKPIKEKEDL